MNRWKVGWWLGLCWACLALHGHGQAAPDLDAAPPAPEARVRDESGFFENRPEALEKISAGFQKLKRDHGYDIYLVIEPLLFRTKPQEYATRLKQEWLPAGNGLVIVFEIDSGTIAIGRDLELDISSETSLVPSFQSSEMINRAAAAVDRELKGDRFLESLMLGITGEFDRYFQQIRAPAPVERSLRTAMLAIGALALMGLLAICLGALVRHSSMAAGRFRFPEVDAVERLGAPCGSSVTARRFARPEEPPP